MIVGSFFPNDVPRVVAELYLPRLDRRGFVHLLVDTGAGHSLIHPTEAKRLHLDLDRDFQERPRQTVKGIGGEEEAWLEEAEITFQHQDGQQTSVEQPILIAVPTDDNRDLPSLLGRDVLHKFQLIYCFPRLELTLTVP